MFKNYYKPGFNKLQSRKSYKLSFVLVGIMMLYLSQHCLGQNKVFTLADCLEIAQSKNLTVKGAEFQVDLSHQDLKRAKFAAYPNLNLNYNLGINNGRSIDPFTNSYINTGLTFSNMGLSTGITLFNGFRIKNAKKQADLDLKASIEEVNQTKQILMLDVTRAYIQVLNDLDQIKLIETRVNTTEGQLLRLEKMRQEGIGNPAEYSDIQGQLHNDQAILEGALNNLRRSKIDIFEMMNMPFSEDVKFEYPSEFILLQAYNYSKEAVIDAAFSELAIFKSSALRIQALESGIKAAKSGAYPSVEFFAQANTNYSSAATTFKEESSVISATGDFVEIDNRSIPVMAEQSVFSENGISYPSQFSNNLNTAFGLSLRMPIFDRMLTKTNVAQQRILKEQAQNFQEQTLVQVKNEIERAYVDLESAFRRIKILEDQVDSYQASFRVNELRYEKGVSNIVAYLISKNNLDQATLTLSSARYNYFLLTKVLDYYRGM